MPNYSLSNTPGKMFADLTMYLIQSMDSTRGLEILSRQCRFSVDAPSWVVDWVGDPDVAKWRTMCGDLCQEEIVGEFRRIVPGDKTTFESWQKGYVEVDKQYVWRSREKQRALNSVQFAVVATAENRRVFVTMGGYSGLGPRN